MYGQHTKGMATTRHRSLVERGGKKTSVKEKGLAHKKIKKNVIKPRSQILKTFEHIELLAKLLDCFVRSDTSNNNQ